MNKAELEKENERLKARVETLVSEGVDLREPSHYDYLALVSELAVQSMMLTSGGEFKAFNNIFEKAMEGLELGEDKELTEGEE